MNDSDPASVRRADVGNVRSLVRRVLRSGGRDLPANEELVFLQDLDDPFSFTGTTDQHDEFRILQEAFRYELEDYVNELLSDDRLTQAEALQLRSAVVAASGRSFNPELALEPFEDAFRAARP